MKKTSLYIDPEVDRAFAWRAATEGVSKAKLVRRVLAAAVAERPRPKARGVFEGARDLGAEADADLALLGNSEKPTDGGGDALTDTSGVVPARAVVGMAGLTMAAALLVMVRLVRTG
jgi:hypothetical protein